MPQLRVVVWNIQNFGSQNDLRWGVNSVRRANFIARYVHSLDAEVFAVLEVMPQALPHLRQLLQSLNALAGANNRWAFDWIRGSLEGAAPDHPSSFNHTTFFGGGSRYEGYAVYWRTGLPHLQPVPAARNLSLGAEAPGGVALGAANFVDLVTKGRPFQVDGAGYQITGGFDPDENETYALRDGQPVTPWVDLNFPSAANGLGLQPRRTSTRRPAFVVLKLDDLGVIRLCPLLIFHAPSRDDRAEIGTLLSGLSRELYATFPLRADGTLDTANLTKVTKVIAAGDFNCNIQAAEWPGVYGVYTDPFAAGAVGGANCEALLHPDTVIDELRRTTVQLKAKVAGRYDGDPLEGDDSTDFRRMKIDHLFLRGIQSRIESEVGDVVSFIETPNSCSAEIRAYSGLIQAYEDSDLFPALDFHKGYYRFDNDRRIKYAIPDIVDWEEHFEPGIKQGYFDTARSAAEFYRYFISDHLPLFLLASFEPVI